MKTYIAIFLLAFLFNSGNTLLFAQGAGNAVKFEGGENYVRVGSSESLNLSTSLTISAWIKVDSTSYTVLSDNFNDNAINFALWQPFTHGNYEVSEDNGLLKIMPGNNSEFAYGGCTTQGKYYFEGDFDVSVDIDNSNIVNNSAHNEISGIAFMDTDDNYWKFWVSIWYDGPHNVAYNTVASNDAVENSSERSSDLTVRFVRRGDEITCYGYDSGTLEYQRTFSTKSTKPIYLSLFHNSDTEIGGAVYFDNFTVSEGKVIASVLQRDSRGYGIAASPTTLMTQINNGYVIEKRDVGTGWNQITVTYDNSIEKMYWNGLLINTYTQEGGVPSWERELFIGALFKGSIDEVRLWNVALTKDQIRTMMCRKLTEDNLASGVSWENLKGYWRFDEGSGVIANDASSNNNYGVVYQSSWDISGAALGDFSTYDYSSPLVVMFPHPDGDIVMLQDITGSPVGVQIYRVDGAPNVMTPPGNMSQLFTSRYFGVRLVGGSSPTYTFIYNYNGNPDIGDFESYQDLATRENNSVQNWTEGNAILNLYDKTLTLTGQTGGEYIDGRDDTQTSADDDTNIPSEFFLSQNYPNPFNPTTTIKYAIPANAGGETHGCVSLRIYNVLGENIATLVNAKQSPGNYSVQFNASNLPSGVYFYTLRVGNFVATKKMILLK